MGDASFTLANGKLNNYPFLSKELILNFQCIGGNQIVNLYSPTNILECHKGMWRVSEMC